MPSEAQNHQIGTEVVQSHILLKWLIGIAGANLGVFLIGGVSIWVNDSAQDGKLLKHGVEIEARQTKAEAKLTRELLEAKINTNSRASDEIKQILFRMEDSISEIRRMDDDLHQRIDPRS